ncbi:MAG: hypothetical protein CVV64_04800 [Candidatus Wallbacteria bacterium HGW-Wallbacteria-1]|jgi:hypothetical protein|uniref:Uncharacterized protein n=1 Tax=Candidatus Wallbacteria bacterium HGW-Wallbacteria-1 TaxID=2013854 RepID=A0A2N1PS43_9BACT|nr:MAG: hypothetical protein CVV64_04800 [Candidatus Wallbacteria bacterium HGW-Wallbacteria-1]
MEKFQPGRKITFAPGVLFEITKVSDGLIAGTFHGESEVFTFSKEQVSQFLTGFLAPPEIGMALEIIRKSRANAKSDHNTETDNSLTASERVRFSGISRSGKILYGLVAVMLCANLVFRFTAGRSTDSSPSPNISETENGRIRLFREKILNVMGEQGKALKPSQDPPGLEDGEFSLICAGDGLMIAHGKKILNPRLLLMPFIEENSNLSESQETVLPMEKEILEALKKWYVLEKNQN